MSENLLSPISYFRWSFPCKRLDDSVPAAPPHPFDLSDDFQLADPRMIDPGGPARAEVRAGWSPAGLAFVIKAPGNSHLVGREIRVPLQAQFWIDTRDARTVHRATKFCQRFVIQVTADGATLKERRSIGRAAAEPPPVDSKLALTDLARTTKDWTFKAFFPAEILHGYDPETNRRLGFACHVLAQGRSDGFPGWDREVPWEEDPSLWTTLELRDSS